MRTINVAVIGLGYWGPNLVRNFRKIASVNVLWGCDKLEKNLERIRNDYPTITTTQHIEDVMHDKTVDVVVIATPVTSHFRLAKEALLAHKHILIEKPMTKTSEQAKELIALAKKVDRLILVGHTFVYSSAVRKIKEITEDRSFGQIYYYDSTRINMGLLQNDSNVVWDLAPHDLSIISFLFRQKPVNLQAFGSSHVEKKKEEMAHIFIRYLHGVTAHIHVSWLSPVKIRTILIGGSKKMIVYDDIKPSEKVSVYDKSIDIPKRAVTPFAPAYRSGEVVIPHLEQVEPLYVELTHFIDCIRSGKKPLTDGNAGLKVVQLLEATDWALKTKSEISLHDFTS